MNGFRSALQPPATWFLTQTTNLVGDGVARAHELPWNMWVVSRDGSGLRQVAAVGAPDASVAWAPDGSQLLVYGSTGVRIIDASTAQTEVLPYLADFGAIAWLS